MSEPDLGGCYHYATGSYADADVSARQVHQPPEVLVPPGLARPITNAPAAEHTLAPSLGHARHGGVAAATHDRDATRRGMAIHRALDLMSREPPLTAVQARQRIRHEAAIADARELEQWVDEARRTIANSDFDAVFKPAAARRILNEQPIVYRDDGRSVSGIIDRIVVNDDSILLVDYKTHQIDDLTALDALATAYEDQMRLYRKGVECLWPGLPIKSGLLFTHSARLVWLNLEA